MKFLFPSDLRALGVAEWLPDTERYAADRAKHVALLAAVEAARQARTGLPAESAPPRARRSSTPSTRATPRRGARPDAAKLMKQADEKLALRQAELVRWADGVLGRVVAEADTVLADNEAQQDRLHEAQEQAQRALDAATASLCAAQRMEIWTRSARAEPSTTVGIPVWSALVDAPYPKAEPRGGSECPPPRRSNGVVYIDRDEHGRLLRAAGTLAPDEAPSWVWRPRRSSSPARDSRAPKPSAGWMIGRQPETRPNARADARRMYCWPSRRRGQRSARRR